MESIKKRALKIKAACWPCAVLVLTCAALRAHLDLKDGG